MKADGVILGFVDGTDYQALSKPNRETWAMGVVDGMIAQALSQKGSIQYYLLNCLEKYDFQQLLAVFEKELMNNPELWHVPAAFTFESSTKNFCAS